MYKRTKAESIAPWSCHIFNLNIIISIGQPLTPKLQCFCSTKLWHFSARINIILLRIIIFVVNRENLFLNGQYGSKILLVHFWKTLTNSLATTKDKGFCRQLFFFTSTKICRHSHIVLGSSVTFLNFGDLNNFRLLSDRINIWRRGRYFSQERIFQSQKLG